MNGPTFTNVPPSPSFMPASSLRPVASLTPTFTPASHILIPLFIFVVICGIIVLIGWYYGAFEPDNTPTGGKPATGGRPPSWCYVGTDNGKRICLKIPTPTACGDITVYASQNACEQGLL